MSATFKLAYFNGKGLAETSRLLLAATETPFEDFRYPIAVVEGKYIKEEFEAAKASFPMGQVPLLTVTTNGTVTEIPQSKAIERYISKKTGLYGANDEEAAIIDAICELVADIKTKYTAAKVDAEKQTAFFNDTFPMLVGFIAKYLEKSSSGFVVGNSISLADVVIFHMINIYFPAELNILEKLPASVAALAAKVATNTGIAKWEAGRATRGEIF